MPHGPHNPRRLPAPPRAASRALRAFTLAELLVAVSVVIVLSVALGQIFSQIGRLVRAGAAVSEVDQAARAIERQFRDDFAAISRLRSDESLFAIRSRVAGDANNDGAVPPSYPNSTDERAIYLTQADKEADQRAGITPYQRDALGKKIGHGVTVRLDEMVFLARSEERSKFSSFQVNGAESQPVNADYARVYWGHGLKPGPARTPAGTAWDPTKPTDLNNRPIRRLFPDTHSVPIPNDPSSDATDANVQRTLNWGQVFGEPLTRNEFASEFTLLRHQLLLVGGRAAGGALSDTRNPRFGTITPQAVDANGAARAVPPFRTYAPLIRDRENQVRSGWGDASLANFFVLGNGWVYPAQTLAGPRLIRWGRTDICAQDRDDVQRWLEGLITSSRYDLTDPAFIPTDATAFSAGMFDYSGDGSPGSQDYLLPPDVNRRADAPLMEVVPSYWGASGLNLSGEQVLAGAATTLRTAVAGVFTRVLCDPAPPAPQRVSTSAGQSLASGSSTPEPFPGDAAMDAHAVIAARCSSFEIAWNDGTVWNDPRPLRVYLGPVSPENLYAQFNQGDLVWFDAVFPRRQFRTINAPGFNVAESATALDRPPDPEVLPSRPSASYFGVTAPVTTNAILNAQDRYSVLGAVPLVNFAHRLLVRPGLGSSALPAENGAYDVSLTGGSDSEYMAVFPFRRPQYVVQGATPRLQWNEESPWQKPKRVRVRMTLHDSLNRIPGGKRFEFVLAIDQSVQQQQ